MAQVCTNDESGLTFTFLQQVQNLIPDAFILEKILKCSFIYSCLSRNHMYTYI